ncbi:hypothetical protein BDW59DRAFT_147456 [Aspergillus cavernicola]|uniref:Uncharacterized protein n=1 Tax=Aspergillus cavernicola TaxID=176166 RepID=A0ABR4I9U2_9EURO
MGFRRRAGKSKGDKLRCRNLEEGQKLETAVVFFIPSLLSCCFLAPGELSDTGGDVRVYICGNLVKMGIGSLFRLSTRVGWDGGVVFDVVVLR